MKLKGLLCRNFPPVAAPKESKKEAKENITTKPIKPGKTKPSIEAQWNHE